METQKIVKLLNDSDNESSKFATRNSANNLPHELLLTTRQTTKLGNAIENNMSTDTNFFKA